MTELERLSKKDIKDAVTGGSGGDGLSRQEARFLVDLYYQFQDYRISSAGQKRALIAAEEEDILIGWAFEQFTMIEKEIHYGLEQFAKNHALGQWAQSIHGIGPVIAAGLLAHIDLEKAPTVGHVWSFAGLNPTVEWEKGKKRPWNAQLKTLCWKIGQSFMKLRNSPNDIYGKVYEERKALEIERNEAGEFADQAAAILERKTFRNQEIKAIYASGKLPAGHIDARARRYAVKLFLAHFHHVGYVLEFDREPPKPYVIEHGGHAHFIKPPNFR